MELYNFVENLSDGVVRSLVFDLVRQVERQEESIESLQRGNEELRYQARCHENENRYDELRGQLSDARFTISRLNAQVEALNNQLAVAQPELVAFRNLINAGDHAGAWAIIPASLKANIDAASNKIEKIKALRIALIPTPGLKDSKDFIEAQPAQ